MGVLETGVVDVLETGVVDVLETGVVETGIGVAGITGVGFPPAASAALGSDTQPPATGL